jgi:hypothetical protein
LCDYTCKSNSALKTHKWGVHDFGEGKILNCDLCTYTCKSNSNLKRHLEYRHDIGAYTCQLCFYNRNSHIEYTCAITKKELFICKSCFHKATGKESRIELKISDILDEMDEIRPFLVGSDNSFRQMGGCSLKRPDKLYISEKLALWIEIDENQHQNNDDYRCDEKRISDAIDEFNGQPLVVIRFNPDKYNVPNGYVRVRLRDRIDKLKSMIVEILSTVQLYPVLVIYMYYDYDNDLIVRSLPKKLIY